MQIIKPFNTTVTLATEQPEYQDLPIVLEERENGDPVLTSYWQPSPEERAEIAAGGLIKLSVLGLNHPPVWIDSFPVEPA